MNRKSFVIMLAISIVINIITGMNYYKIKDEKEAFLRSQLIDGSVLFGYLNGVELDLKKAIKDPTSIDEEAIRNSKVQVIKALTVFPFYNALIYEKHNVSTGFLFHVISSSHTMIDESPTDLDKLNKVIRYLEIIKTQLDPQVISSNDSEKVKNMFDELEQTIEKEGLPEV